MELPGYPTDIFECTPQRFCSALKFKTSHDLLIGEIEEVIDPAKEDALMSEDPTQMHNMFELYAKALHYVKALGIYQSDTQGKRLQLIPVVDCAIHIY